MAEATAGWQLDIDRETCMGSGLCLVYAPNTFAQDEATKAVVRDPSGDPPAAVRIAVDACPTGARSLVTS